MTDLRIVTLLPSATEIVAALGLSDAIVGRSHECDYPPEIKTRPVCTRARLNSQQPSAQIDADVQTLLRSALSIYDVLIDELERLQPTHIVTQDQCDVCAVNFSEVEKAVSSLTRSQPKIISLQPNTLSEVWADLDRVAVQLGVDAALLLNSLQSRIKACSEMTKTASRPTVAAIEWIDPLMASGNWIPELITFAGGRDLFGSVGKHSPYLQWHDLIAADPDTIVMMPCGFDLDRTRQEAQTLTQRSEWQSLKAVQNNQIYITDGNAYFNRPSHRLVDSMEILCEILHPEQFKPQHQGVGWEVYQAR